MPSRTQNNTFDSRARRAAHTENGRRNAQTTTAPASRQRRAAPSPSPQPEVPPVGRRARRRQTTPRTSVPPEENPNFSSYALGGWDISYGAGWPVPETDWSLPPPVEVPEPTIAPNPTDSWGLHPMNTTVVTDSGRPMPATMTVPPPTPAATVVNSSLSRPILFTPGGIRTPTPPRSGLRDPRPRPEPTLTDLPHSPTPSDLPTLVSDTPANAAPPPQPSNRHHRIMETLLSIPFAPHLDESEYDDHDTPLLPPDFMRAIDPTLNAFIIQRLMDAHKEHVAQLELLKAHIGVLEKRLDITAKALCCMVCEDPLWQARTLLCGHSFCYDCLVKLGQIREQRNKCPVCRDGSGWDFMQVNFKIEELVSLYYRRPQIATEQES